MNKDKCPRCHEGRMHRWDELTDDEQEIVRRLPESADYTAAERAVRHTWCTRCWFEAIGGVAHA
jgi:23S rRNA maturation mini-RNase III